MKLHPALAVAAAVATISLTAPANASWHQPYGGCEEGTLAPHSAGANECRDHGWTIRKRLAVNPRHVVKGSGLPHCREEDGSDQRPACSWNFHDGQRDGNGRGASYWVDWHDHVHYVWAQSPVTDGWSWSNARQSRAMGRHDCIVKHGTTVASGLIARCPG
jgi:hypothetical protein